ncbi:hypothetical protein PHMEG_00031880, partial [Phytophthora megakarya]
MVQRHKAATEAGLNDAQRAFEVLDEFSGQNEGNVAQVLVDPETNIVRIATFQTARMKRFFMAFPEVVLVDSTHDTNANRYKLFSFVVHDVFGKTANKRITCGTYKGVVLESLGDNSSHEQYKRFLTYWDCSKDEWIVYLRGDVPYLTNNTNNRIESKWRKLKNVINGSFTMDQLLSTLITLQEYAAEQYLAEYHRVGSRPSRECPNTDYVVDIQADTARVESPISGRVHLVNVRVRRLDVYVRLRFHDDVAVAMQTRYVHAEYLQLRDSCFTFAVFRNKVEFSKSREQYRYRTKEKDLSGANMYIEAKALAEKIVDRMALQTTPTFKIALKWLEDFYNALSFGEVVDFADREASSFPGLSQVSSVGGASLSQLSFIGDILVRCDDRDADLGNTGAEEHGDNITSAISGGTKISESEPEIKIEDAHKLEVESPGQPGVEYDGLHRDTEFK